MRMQNYVASHEHTSDLLVLVATRRPHCLVSFRFCCIAAVPTNRGFPIVAEGAVMPPFAKLKVSTAVKEAQGVSIVLEDDRDKDRYQIPWASGRQRHEILLLVQ